MDDNTQLGQFAQTGSQEAFRELVGRHTDLVYACAMQRLHDAHAAQDVTQAVFLTLALKAKDLLSHTSLAGWLFTTTRYVAARYQRGEQRRKEREMRAFEENQIADAGTAEAAWEELEPHLAGALDSLSGADREAVLLRFYRKASHQEVAAALGTSEDGARMRVERALDKLRRFFTKKGMALSATALFGALTANAAPGAPVGLAATASATALAGVSGTLATASTLALAKGAIHMMLVAQVKTVTAVAAACVVVAGGGVIVAKEALTPPAAPARAGGEAIAGAKTGVVMAVVTPDRVVTPPSGEETKFEIGLRIANRTDQDISFDLFDTVRPAMKDDRGRELPLDGGRGKTRIPQPIQVKAGQTGAVVALRPETGLASEVPADLRPMQGFQYPIELHENGKVKTLIVAGEVIPGDPKDAIHARRVRVEFFDEAGRATGLIKVDECRYWRDKGRVESDSDIYLDKDGILITGRGLEWTIKEQRIIIRENVKIVLTRSGGPTGTVASPGRAGTGKRTTHAD